MVAGIVQAPRIDLTNEELIRSHINATVLSFLNAEEFKPSLIDLIDIAGGTYKLKSDIKAKYWRHTRWKIPDKFRRYNFNLA